MNLENIDALHDLHIDTVEQHPRGEKLAKVWVIAKPILKLAKGIFFFKPKFVSVIDILIEEIDLITGTGN